MSAYANRLFAEADYRAALSAYSRIASEMPLIRSSAIANMLRCIQRLGERQDARRTNPGVGGNSLLGSCIFPLSKRLHVDVKAIEYLIMSSENNSDEAKSIAQECALNSPFQRELLIASLGDDERDLNAGLTVGAGVMSLLSWGRIVTDRVYWLSNRALLRMILSGTDCIDPRAYKLLECGPTDTHETRQIRTVTATAPVCSSDPPASGRIYNVQIKDPIRGIRGIYEAYTECDILCVKFSKELISSMVSRRVCWLFPDPANKIRYFFSAAAP